LINSKNKFLLFFPKCFTYSHPSSLLLEALFFELSRTKL
jgi:hypothetical protein